MRGCRAESHYFDLSYSDQAAIMVTPWWAAVDTRLGT